MTNFVANGKCNLNLMVCTILMFIDFRDLQSQYFLVSHLKSWYVSNRLGFSHHQITDFSITYRCAEQGEECWEAITEVAK